jgi:hypothetical protein
MDVEVIVLILECLSFAGLMADLLSLRSFLEFYLIYNHNIKFQSPYGFWKASKKLKNVNSIRSLEQYLSDKQLYFHSEILQRPVIESKDIPQ